MIRKGRRGSAPSHERWLVSYADFVTLLFALFIVLFASAYKDKRSITKVSSAVRAGFDQTQPATRAGAENGARQSSPGTQAAATPATRAERSPAIVTEEMRRKLREAMGPHTAESAVVMRMTPDGPVISLQELGFFASGEANLLPGAEPKVRALAHVLTQYGVDLRIEGHTDNAPMHGGRFASNWELSTARASAVARILLDSGDFDPRRVSLAGYGEYHPVASNDTPSGRQTNRRVDIVLLTGDPSPSPLTGTTAVTPIP